MRHKIKGFSLLEVTIALVIMVGLMAVIIPVLRDEGDARRTDDLINQHAREYKMLYDASTKWVAENESAMASATTISIAIADLITDGYLPAEFGKRSTSGSVGEALIGGTYAVYARKDDLSGAGGQPDQVRVAITETGIFKPPLARKVGMTSPVGHTPYKEQSNSYVNRLLIVGQRDYKLVGGLLKSGTTDGIGLKGAFTQSLSQFLSAETDAGRPIIFWGFTGVNPGAGEPPSGGGGNDSPGECNVVFGTGGNDAVCPAPFTAIIEWAPCWPGLPDIIGVPEVGAAITVGIVTETESAIGSLNCIFGGGTTYCSGLHNIKLYRTFSINNAEVGRRECTSTFWHDSWYPWETSGYPYFNNRPHGHVRTSYGTVASFINGGQGCQSYDPVADNALCLAGGSSQLISKFTSTNVSSSGYQKAKICCRD